MSKAREELASFESRSRLGRYLFESGRYAELQSQLHARLSEECWYTKVEEHLKDALRLTPLMCKQTDIAELAAMTELEAIGTISSDTREQLLAACRASIKSSIISSQ